MRKDTAFRPGMTIWEISRLWRMQTGRWRSGRSMILRAMWQRWRMPWVSAVFMPMMPWEMPQRWQRMWEPKWKRCPPMPMMPLEECSGQWMLKTGKAAPFMIKLEISLRWQTRTAEPQPISMIPWDEWRNPWMRLEAGIPIPIMRQGCWRKRKMQGIRPPLISMMLWAESQVWPMRLVPYPILMMEMEMYWRWPMRAEPLPGNMMPKTVWRSIRMPGAIP